jgi:hypothetical protein
MVALDLDTEFVSGRKLSFFVGRTRKPFMCGVWLDFCDGLGSEIQPKSERRPGVQDVDDEEVADSRGISDREASNVYQRIQI